MSLLIAILNYRTPAVTGECLASLAPCIGEVEATRVVVVDNASGDESVPFLASLIERKGWQRWCHLIASPTNTGFAGGNNLVMSHLRRPEHAQTRWVLLLNSDTIVRPGVLAHCAGVMDRDVRLGAMSCRLDNPDGTPQHTARRFPTPARMAAGAVGLPWYLPGAFGWADVDDPSWDRSTPKLREVDWIGGAFMFIDAQVYIRLGGMDERFFFYGEDIEYCLRIRRSGRTIAYDGRVGITHLGGASSDPTRLPQKVRSSYAWQSRYAVQRRCYGAWAAAMLRCIDVAAYGIRSLVPGRAERRRLHRDVLAMLVRPLPEAHSPVNGTAQTVAAAGGGAA